MSGIGLLLQLVFGFAVVLAPGVVVARALGVRRVSAALGWSLTLVFAGLALTFALGLSLTFTLGAMVFLLLAVAAIVVVPVILKLIPFGGIIQSLLSIARWPLLFIGLLFALACLYRYGPSRDKAEWRWVTWGSGIAGAVWLLGSMLFSWYVANFGNYNETYGSLGAAIGFMTWIWLSTTIVLLGGELNAELEHQTAKDTTEGPKQPLGARGAKMADQVGAAHA